MTGDERRRVVVIGAGAVGIISAIEALRRGFRVTVVEPGVPGGQQAASYGNAGWLSSHSVIPPSMPGLWKQVPGMLLDRKGPLTLDWGYLPKVAPWLVGYLLSGQTRAKVEATARALRPLIVDAPALHKQLAVDAGVGDLIEHNGVLHVYLSKQAFEADGLAWAIRRGVGIGWTEVAAAALRQREPDLDGRYGFAVEVAEAGRCRDPGQYVAALADHARSLGAEFVVARAHGFRLEGERLRAVVIDGGEIACDAAVLAAGIHSAPLARSIGDRLPLEAERGYHVVIRDSVIGPRASMMASDARIVVSQTVGGVRASGQVEIAAADAAPDWRRADIVRDHLLSMFPGLAKRAESLDIVRWMGSRPSMTDGRPCIGHSRPSRDIVYAFGHGHIGLTASARTGKIVAGLLAGEQPATPVEPFSPRRFLPN